jgi:predicted signal transduction protein with EAL and GGDEF domain
MNLVAPEMTRLVVQQACDEHGVSVSKLIGNYVELTQAMKRQTVAREAETVEDNEVRLKANDALKDVLDRAVMMPPIQHRETAPRMEGGKIRMVQIDPDGTERILEVG